MDSMSIIGLERQWIVGAKSIKMTGSCLLLKKKKAIDNKMW